MPKKQITFKNRLISCLIFFVLMFFIVGINFSPIGLAFADEQQRYCDDFYSNTGTTVSVTVNKTYARYTKTETYMSRLLPEYEETEFSNSCAVVAGTILMGYYDYTCENLIPNFSACYLYNGTYRYRGQNSTINAVKAELYDLMGTNVGGEGTTRSGFLSGLNSYVSSCDYTLSRTQISYNSSFKTNCINAFNNDRPVAVFVTGYRYYSYAGLTIGDTSATFIGKDSPNGHACIAYGYVEYTFYNADNTSWIESYLAVSFGNSTAGLLSLDTTTNVDVADSIYIY